MCNMIVLKN